MDDHHCPFFGVSAMAGGRAEAEEVIASKIRSDREVKEGRSAFFMKIVLMIDDAMDGRWRWRLQSKEGTIDHTIDHSE